MIGRPVRDVPLPGLEDQRGGYRAPVAARVAGITYRQLDYWDETGLIHPTIRPARGSGTQRLYAVDDIVELRIAKRLLDTGVSLQRIRRVIEHIRDRALPLRTVTIASDGRDVFTVDDARDIVDALAGGRGVFAIAVEGVYTETERDVAHLPAERIHPPPPTTED